MLDRNANSSSTRPLTASSPDVEDHKTNVQQKETVSAPIEN